ncbi:MAG TPA: NAD(P)H-dependent oxidoreductase [Usitatibacter sp.]|nr:NAD(P)H-dependent oxidoreductase [Usitatibacter sp.]
MAQKRKVAVIVGSIRKGSFSRMVAKAMCGLAPGLECEIVEIAQLSMYNQDLDENPPAEWVAFKDRIKAADAVLFVTPEYNRSMPGVLKNAIDVASRPYGKSAWAKKPCAVVSVTPGALGAFGANHHLRQSLVFLDMPAMQQPEAYVSNISRSLDDKGSLSSDETREFLRKFMEAFSSWIEANTAPAPGAAKAA